AKSYLSAGIASANGTSSRSRIDNSRSWIWPMVAAESAANIKEQESAHNAPVRASKFIGSPVWLQCVTIRSRDVIRISEMLRPPRPGSDRNRPITGLATIQEQFGK